MSIFDSIVSAIFSSAKVAEAPHPTSAGTTPRATTAAATPDPRPATPAPKTTAAPGPTAAGATPLSQIDVEAVLAKLAAQKKEKLDWRKSIVDLMKLLDLDSSLGARKQLAKELNYAGDTNDSASMNIWLHKQVMMKLAASGGRVPEDLKS